MQLKLNLVEKAMAPHSSNFAQKIPWTEEPGRLQSMGSLESDTTERLHFHFHAMEKEMATHSSVLAWRIPETGSLAGCHLWGRTESDTTEVTQQQQQGRFQFLLSCVCVVRGTLKSSYCLTSVTVVLLLCFRNTVFTYPYVGVRCLNSFFFC